MTTEWASALGVGKAPGASNRGGDARESLLDAADPMGDVFERVDDRLSAEGIFWAS